MIRISLFLSLLIFVILLLAACDAVPQETNENPGEAVLKKFILVTPGIKGNSAAVRAPGRCKITVGVEREKVAKVVER